MQTAILKQRVAVMFFNNIVDNFSPYPFEGWVVLRKFVGLY